MSFWVFLLWMALGIVLAVLLARYIPLRRPARAASEKGPACD